MRMRSARRSTRSRGRGSCKNRNGRRMARRSKRRRMKDVARKRERAMRRTWGTRTAEMAREPRRKGRGGDGRAGSKHEDGDGTEGWTGIRRGTSTTAHKYRRYRQEEKQLRHRREQTRGECQRNQHMQTIYKSTLIVVPASMGLRRQDQPPGRPPHRAPRFPRQPSAMCITSV